MNQAWQKWTRVVRTIFRSAFYKCGSFFTKEVKSRHSNNDEYKKGTEDLFFLNSPWLQGVLNFMVFDEGCTFQFPSLKIHFGKMLMNEVWHHFKSARVDMFITFVSFIPSCSTIESLSRGMYIYTTYLYLLSTNKVHNCCQAAAKYFEGSFHLL